MIQIQELGVRIRKYLCSFGHELHVQVSIVLWIDDSFGLQNYWREHKLVDNEYKNIQGFVPPENEKLN